MYTSPGELVQKPIVTRAVLIVLSSLIGLQLVGLAYLMYYIYHVPTWTGALDAIAMARIGATLSDNMSLPFDAEVELRDIERLKDVDGLVGLQPRNSGKNNVDSGSVHQDRGEDVELQQLRWTSVDEVTHSNASGTCE